MGDWTFEFAHVSSQPEYLFSYPVFSAASLDLQQPAVN